MDTLALRGFDPKLMIFAFGFGGTVYKESLDHMQQLGVSTATITKSLKEVRLRSVTCVANIITQCRNLDEQKLQQPQRTQQQSPPIQSRPQAFIRAGGVCGPADRLCDERLKACCFMYTNECDRCFGT